MLKSELKPGMLCKHKYGGIVKITEVGEGRNPTHKAVWVTTPTRSYYQKGAEIGQPVTGYSGRESASFLYRVNDKHERIATPSYDKRKRNAVKKEFAKQAEKEARANLVRDLTLLGIEAWEASAGRKRGDRRFPVIVVNGEHAQLLQELITEKAQESVKELLTTNG